MTRFATTPGVYIKEKAAFSRSVVAVPTAIPVFIGYTQKTESEPVRIESFTEFKTVFGDAPKAGFKLSAKDKLKLELDADSSYYLYQSIRMFYANGGGVCYVISVGDYTEKVSKAKLLEGVVALLTEDEPSLIVLPDAVLLPKKDCYDLYQNILKHCVYVQNRLAIFDIHSGYKKDKSEIDDFREQIGETGLSYGAAYYPWLKTTIVPRSKVNFTAIKNKSVLVDVLTKEAQARYLGGAEGKSKSKKAPTSAASQSRAERRFKEAKKIIDSIVNPKVNVKSTDQNLKAISTKYVQLLADMHEKLNLMPPSGAMAGVYAQVDNSLGVQRAPANIVLSSVIAPSIGLTAEDQSDLNLPINGKAVNAIRTFVGRGTLVWGARTLDGNSQDWRYINVRRTMIMLEQSIKNMVERFVFESNEERTWTRIRMAISGFLTRMWGEGVLVGNNPAEAYDVELGLGGTMTPEEVLEGIMRISIRVAIARPAEFIEITFEQKMQEGLIENEMEDADFEEDEEEEEEDDLDFTPKSSTKKPSGPGSKGGPIGGITPPGGKK